MTASGRVDDDVAIKAPGINRAGGTQGSARNFNETGSSVPPGIYKVRVVHNNIENHPAGNISILTGTLGPCPQAEVVPDDNEETSCDDCSCGGNSDDDGGDENNNSRSLANTLIAPFASSSGGSGVVRSANERHMRFAFDFGSFRGMGHIPGGQLEIVAFGYDANTMLTPAALTYKHPLASVIISQGDRVDANEIFRVFDGASYTNYIVQGDGSCAFGVGATRKKTEQVHFVTALNKAASVECNIADENVAYIRIENADGSAIFYDIETNEFAAYISQDDAIVFTDEKLSIVRNADGSIRQVWNYWDGLADIVPAADGNGYTISLYLPEQIALPEEEGGLFQFSGNPFKTFVISGDTVAQTLTVHERDLSLPESMPDYITTWTKSAGGWDIATGEGDDIITETRTKETIEGSDNYRIITTLSKGGVVASCVAEVFSSTIQGELCLSRTEAYGTDYAQTTTFEYDSAGRQVLRIASDGGEYKTIYDAYGRVSVERSPWAGGRYRITTTTYREASVYNSDPAKVEECYVSASGSVITMRTDTYTYSEADDVRRVVVNSTAGGSSVTQQTISETWLATADNPYARGRIKMTQAVNGVQTCYEYAATTTHNALYIVTQETKVNGELVAGQSRRMVTYISAGGNTMRTEEYALLNDGETWALLSGITNTYDVKNRLVGAVKDNGRTTSRTLTCTGAPLTETDEDGITTTYGYNTARRLVEVIRGEIRDGDTLITPETITTYTHDAAGRTLSERQDVGALTTTKTTVYDLLGRTVSRTDVLGRVTTTIYSPDGRSTTVTRPNGATLITTRNTDGSVAHVYGTGQRELYHVYDLNGSTLRESVKLADQATTIYQVLQNGFGETVVETTAVPGGFNYDRSTYNAKGQLTRRQRDIGGGSSTQSMAPTLYEYDAFGNMTKQTLLLDDTATDDVTKNRIEQQAFSVEAAEDGIYAVTSITRYAAGGTAITTVQKQMLSKLSAILENKTLSINERSLTSTSWTEYGSNTKRIQKQTIPTSNITAESVRVDGFVLSQKDHAGIVSTRTRQYTANGMTQTQTDGRGNTTIIATDKRGRTLSVTDAAGNITTTAYSLDSDNPATITNAQGKTTCYRYDVRGRKVAEWGTAIQPALFAYDDADRLVSLTTFRANEGDVTTDPADRTDGDTTQWAYDDASGKELTKTYADGSTITKTYDVFGRLSTETNARGMVKTLAYDAPTGQLIGIGFSDVDTPAQAFEYNVQGQLTQVTDAAGTRTLNYNEYGELVTDSLVADAKTHLITENRDACGRSSGYTYAKDNSVQQTVNYAYGEDGRMVNAGFTHSGASKQFTYGYLAGSNLLQTLTMPNGMSLTQEYETQRDLLSAMLYKRGETGVVERYYTYDSLGRPLTRQENRQGGSRSDSFTHNDRSELSTATLGNAAYSYAYDNIGNRKTAQENAEEATAYAANNLNQYTAVGDFVPEFDADGNQTKVQTSTGIWNVTYNAENRPTVFSRENANGSITRVTCAYDYMGRRATKKVETITTDAETEESTSSTTLNQCYLYRGYLQVACCDLTRSAHPCLWLITWDPTQPVATRPLAIQKDATWYVYGWDLTKNICEVFGSDGYIKTVYSYTPYGAVSTEGSVEQFFQWSSEYYDSELGLVYYNYRHYNPRDGRWTGRDLVGEMASLGLYKAFKNSLIDYLDVLGLANIKTDYEKQCREEPIVIPQNGKCPKYNIVFIGGNSDDSSKVMWGLKTTVAHSLKKHATSAISYYFWNVDSEELANRIEQHHKRCPKTKIIILGHSWGGDTAMDVCEDLQIDNSVMLITLDPVSICDTYNWSTKRPKSINYWINSYVRKGAFDSVGFVPAAGQILSFVGTYLTTFDFNNSVASAGGKWGYEDAADVNIRFDLYGDTDHANTYGLFAYAENNKNKSAYDFLWDKLGDNFIDMDKLFDNILSMYGVKL